MTMCAEEIAIDGNTVYNAIVQGGCVVKKYSYKYGTVSIAVLLDGVRDGHQVYCLARTISKRM